MKAWKLIQEYAVITLGLLCFTASWTVFLLPHHLVGGGFSGVAALLQYATGIPTSLSYFALNAVLLVIAIMTIGWKFGIKIVYGIVMASLFFEFWPMVIPADFIAEVSLSNSKLVSALIGGAFSGLGVGLALTRQGSTGGTDIIAQIINKYRNISPGRIIFLCDMVIIFSSLFVTDEPNLGLRFARVVYGYLIVFICSHVVDMILSGAKKSVQYFVLSPKYEEIAHRISHEVRRGVTLLDGSGYYSHKDVKVIIIVARSTDCPAINRIIKEVDPTAFLSIGTVSGVYGKGFDRIRK